MTPAYQTLIGCDRRFRTIITLLTIIIVLIGVTATLAGWAIQDSATLRQQMYYETRELNVGTAVSTADIVRLQHDVAEIKRDLRELLLVGKSKGAQE